MNKAYRKFIKKALHIVQQEPFPPKFEPEKWEEYIEKANCYAYALRLRTDLRDIRVVPGFLSKQLKTTDRKIRKNFTVNKIIEDVRSDFQILGFEMKVSSVEEECDENAYKIAIFLNKGKDFHFARSEDRDGWWSAKNGWLNGIDIFQGRELQDYCPYPLIGIYKITRKENACRR